MNKKWIIGLVILIVVLLVGIKLIQGTSDKSKGNKVSTTSLKSVEMVEKVMTPGILKLDKEQTVFAQPERGEIAEIFVKEGSKVSVGEPLIRYQNSELELEKKQNNIQARLLELQRTSLVNKHADIDKLLAETPDDSAIKAEHDQVQLEQEQANLEQEQLNLQINTLNEKVSNLTVKSEIDGTVVILNEDAKSGIGQAGEQPLLRIGSLNNLVVEGSVSEFDTLNIKVGQKVKLTSEASPEEKWTGKVSYIADLPLESQGGKEDSVTYPVTITVEDEVKLKPGFTMLVEIETSKEKVMSLPLTSILQEDDQDYVLVVKKGKAVKQDVKLGSVEKDNVAITSGLDKEDKVIVEATEELVGAEVTVK